MQVGDRYVAVLVKGVLLGLEYGENLGDLEGVWKDCSPEADIDPVGEKNDADIQGELQYLGGDLVEPINVGRLHVLYNVFHLLN